MGNCPFCTLAEGAENDLLALRTPLVFVVPSLRQRPANRGHMLVVPIAHVTRMIDVEPALAQELYMVAARVTTAVRKAFGAAGATVFQNDEAPDQDLLHVHIHIVPRKPGDDFKLPDPMTEEGSREERLRQAIAMRSALG